MLSHRLSHLLSHLLPLSLPLSPPQAFYVVAGLFTYGLMAFNDRWLATWTADAEAARKTAVGFMSLARILTVLLPRVRRAAYLCRAP